MDVATVVTIYVRHSAECKYAGDEFARRCDCRKHLRWTLAGKRYRRKAGTRSWTEAEKVKRGLEDQLAGRASASSESGKSLGDAIEVFLLDKKVQGLSPDLLGKYALGLRRLRAYCESRGVFVVQGITREVITGFCASWP